MLLKMPHDSILETISIHTHWDPGYHSRMEIKALHYLKHLIKKNHAEDLQVA